MTYFAEVLCIPSKCSCSNGKTPSDSGLGGERLISGVSGNSGRGKGRSSVLPDIRISLRAKLRGKGTQSWERILGCRTLALYRSRYDRRSF